MKLNYKRTVLVGFAFFLICAFWQVYDVTIAMTLTSKFGLSQTASGVVMALDNILALFMLPLFGGISDRCKSKSGRRTPFIRTGTVLAVAFLMLLSLADNAQLKNIEAYTKVNDPATMERIYDEQASATLKTPEGVEFKLEDLYTREEFAQLGVDTFTVSRGMVNTMADIRGVGIWVNFTESENGVLCEIRSADVNINPIAVKYGGGGHAKASGATVPDRETAMAMLRDLDAMLGE